MGNMSHKAHNSHINISVSQERHMFSWLQNLRKIFAVSLLKGEPWEIVTHILNITARSNEHNTYSQVAAY